MTDQEFIEELRNKILLTLNINDYKAIREVFDTNYGFNELSNLKQRIEYCIIYGEHLSAMLTINFLLEYFVKIALIYNYTLKNKNENITIDSHPFAPTEELEFPTDIYDEKNLHNNLEKMKNVELINDEEFERLNFFKEKYRNTLSHANRKKLYENVSIPIEAITVENSELVSKGKKMEKLALMPFADFIFLEKFSKECSIPYFLELDKIIKNVVGRIIPKKEVVEN